jgi:uncharacterized protein YecT (DUF1311 family)
MLMLLLLAGAAATHPPVPKPSVLPGPQTQRALAEYKHADAEMTTQWRVTNAFMKGKDAQDHKRSGFAFATALLTSQRAWITYRDAACRVEGGEYAADVKQALIVAQCKAALTRARTLQLRGLMVVQ